MITIAKQALHLSIGDDSDENLSSEKALSFMFSKQFRSPRKSLGHHRSAGAV
jgi:hypothetical protein